MDDGQLNTNAAIGLESDTSSARTLALCLAALAFFAEGIGTQAMGLAAPAILAAWSIPRAALALPTALGLVGFAGGAIFGGVGGDRFGRRAALTGSLLLLGAFTAACALARNPIELGIVRILAGVGLGASLPVAATIMAEAAPARVRSMAMAVGLAFLPLGGFAAGLGASVILPVWGWRGLFAAAGGIGLALALVGGLVFGRERPAVSAPDRAALPSRVPSLQNVRAVLTFAERRDTLGLWGAFFCIVLLYYSMFSWAPTAFASLGMNLAAASRTMSSFSVGGLIGGLCAGALAQRLGSRGTLWILCLGALATALPMPTFAHMAARDARPLTIAVALLGATVIGVQTLLYAMGPQIYAPLHRSTGLGLAVGAGRIGAIASSFTGVIALDVGGARGFFGSIALAIALALACGALISRHIPARSDA
jgi:MFS transporter, AAHS family, 4-hydroxybenzoate transporter